MYAARRLGKDTRIWRGFPLVYLGVMFVGVPLSFLGLSSLFQKDRKGLTVIGAFVVIVVFFCVEISYTGAFTKMVSGPVCFGDGRTRTSSQGDA